MEGRSIFERYTERARQVVVLAQDEARTMMHNYIGSEHLLLGLIREEEGIAARVLAELSLDLDKVRESIVKIVGKGDAVIPGQIPFTPRAKKVQELALREGLSLGHNYVGTEHLLLGLALEREGIANKVLTENGINGEQIRLAIIEMLSFGRNKVATRRKSPVVNSDALRHLADQINDLKQSLEDRKQEIISAYENDLPVLEEQIAGLQELKQISQEKLLGLK